jgi:hypothetical protein
MVNHFGALINLSVTSDEEEGADDRTGGGDDGPPSVSFANVLSFENAASDGWTGASCT